MDGREPSGETGAEREQGEPTAAEMIRFVREVYGDILDEETMTSIEEDFRGDFDDACGYLLTTLVENGVDEDDYLAAGRVDYFLKAIRAIYLLY